MVLENKVFLIVYPDSIGGNLSNLKKFLDLIDKSVKGVHILPPYPSSGDRGFSPISHKKIDSKFGNWKSFTEISNKYQVCLDIVVNHLSRESEEFKDVIKKGKKSKYYDLFVDVKTLGKIQKEDLEKIPVRKEEKPFVKVKTIEGYKNFWCTFTNQQIDLNYKTAITYIFLKDLIEFLSTKNVKLFRLDALGYVTKRLGTRCFLIEPDFYEILDWFYLECKKYDIAILPEVHDHSSFQRAISKKGAYSYSFVLPPLVLYSLLNNDFTYLRHYLRDVPTPSVTVLDTHDGICIPDVDGYLPDDELNKVVLHVQSKGGKTINRKGSRKLHSVGGIYQLNCTFYEALNKDDFLYLASRAIQFFTPGIPQVYYVGLLAGENNFENINSKTDPREINRKSYAFKEACESLEKPIIKKLLKLMEFRNTHPSFNGEFFQETTDDDILRISWQKKEQISTLYIDLKKRFIRILYTSKDFKILTLEV